MQLMESRDNYAALEKFGLLWNFSGIVTAVA
jgi:hypothetical protein